MSSDDLEQEVKKSMVEKFEGEHIRIKNFGLVHEAGNEYSGILDTDEENGSFTYKVKVIYDGSSFAWEIVD